MMGFVGPYVLDRQPPPWIHGIGVYLLARFRRGRAVVSYVGRGRLRSRLRQHARDRRADVFFAKRLRSEAAIVRAECELFHEQLLQTRLDNRIHPAVPAGERCLKCGASATARR